MIVEDNSDFSTARDGIEFKYGTIVVLGSTTFFYVLVKGAVKSIRRPTSLNEEEWSWRNLYVSWIHSCLCAMWVLMCILMYPELFNDPVYHINYVTYFCTCFGTGYFLYDFLDIVCNKKISLRWEIVIHHIACFALFYYCIYMKALIGFSILALSVEVNSVFLHWRRLLLIVRTPFESPKYILIKYLNLATYLVFRGAPLYIITSSCFTMYHLVTLEFLTLGCTAMFLLDIMNVVLFWRCFKNDVIRGSNRFIFKKEKINCNKRDSNCNIVSKNKNSGS
ncbi:unnamed protein product [Lymnaea stagnalis]|uniref:TLC domain-containing protein n=1 Tax=Lymnaea stagnalis TaxID=6523 RepID=A0AAV2ICM7_LYMST